MLISWEHSKQIRAERKADRSAVPPALRVRSSGARRRGRWPASLHIAASTRRQNRSAPDQRIPDLPKECRRHRMEASGQPFEDHRRWSGATISGPRLSWPKRLASAVTPWGALVSLHAARIPPSKGKRFRNRNQLFPAAGRGKLLNAKSRNAEDQASVRQSMARCEHANSRRYFDDISRN